MCADVFVAGAPEMRVTVGFGERVTIGLPNGEGITIAVGRWPVEDHAAVGETRESAPPASDDAQKRSSGCFQGRSDAEARADMLTALTNAPRGLGRDDLRRAARTSVNKMKRIQADLLAEGLVERRKRKLRLVGLPRPAALSPHEQRTERQAERDERRKARHEAKRKERAARHAANYDAADVYFVQSAAGEPIKIGASSNPENRLVGMQGTCPIPLKILAIVPNGGFNLERRLHEQFADERRHGEWFTPSPALLAWIAANAVPWVEPASVDELLNPDDDADDGTPRHDGELTH